MVDGEEGGIEKEPVFFCLEHWKSCRVSQQDKVPEEKLL